MLIFSWEVKVLAYYRLQYKEDNSFLSSRGQSQPCHYEGYLTHGCLGHGCGLQDPILHKDMEVWFL